ncbi:MAG: ribonuclease III [Burkholderiales bacterium]
MARSTSFESRLGYRFHRAALLQQALTHRSYGTPHNERLEFLGDGVLGCVIAQELFSRFPEIPEGQLTRLRASLVREEALSALARELGLPEALLLGDAELAVGRDARPSILADGLEAVFGAVFLDGGYDAARELILRTYNEAIVSLRPEATAKDAKSRLQELMQARHRSLPEYRVVATHGAAHKQVFEVECVLPEIELRATGTGTSRQRAEQRAAEALLADLLK